MSKSKNAQIADYMEVYGNIRVTSASFRELSAQGEIALAAGDSLAIESLVGCAGTSAQVLIVGFERYESVVPEAVRRALQSRTADPLLRVSNAQELEAKLHAEYFPFNKR